MSSIAARYSPGRLLTRSVAKKQVVAITGFLLVLFILGHLGGNLLIFLGPAWFNAYAKHLASLGPLLWVIRLGLITVFLVHIGFTVWVTLENRKARGDQAYEAFNPKGGDKWATRTMIWTGILVFLFIFFHIAHFTLGDKQGESSVITLGKYTEQLGLFGLVWNRFTSFFWSLFYIVAVTAVGMHLSHGVQSTFQSFGFDPEQFGGIAGKVSLAVGAIVAVGFSAIPIYVIITHYSAGIGQ